MKKDYFMKIFARRMKYKPSSYSYVHLYDMIGLQVYLFLNKGETKYCVVSALNLYLVVL